MLTILISHILYKISVIRFDVVIKFIRIIRSTNIRKFGIIPFFENLQLQIHSLTAGIKYNGLNGILVQGKTRMQGLCSTLPWSRLPLHERKLDWV